MTRKRIAFGLILIAAFCGVALAMRPNATDQSTLTDNESVVQAERVDYEARFRQIGRDLERERERRLELAAEVADLRRQLASASAPRGLAPGDVEEENHAGSSAEEAIEERRPRGLDVEALVAAGFPESEVRAFKQRIDQIELDRLYLRDLAAREGWLDSPRFREEVGDLSLDANATRQEFGEDFYDWMLYTTGHPNRVRVGEVMEGSAAAEAGLLPGDLILRYGEQRIFSAEELRDATIAGTAGEATSVAVVREGRETQIYMPRGPLGIRIDFAAEEPKPVS